MQYYIYTQVFRRIFCKKKASGTSLTLSITGAENEIRTRDPRLGKAMLYR